MDGLLTFWTKKVTLRKMRFIRKRFEDKHNHTKKKYIQKIVQKIYHLELGKQRETLNIQAEKEIKSKRGMLRDVPVLLTV